MNILLNDILSISELSNVKIRFNKDNNANFNPIRLFKENKDALLNGHFHNYNKKSYKEGDITIGFARISKDKWLLFDISIITKDLNIYNAVGYEYQTLESYRKYFGRLIIEYHNKSQNLIRNANTLIDDLTVHQILEDTFDNDLFPGYENVNISWKDLNRVTKKSNWKTALQNQKGIYLITDKLNGKQYVGAAYGVEMLLGRWQNYIHNGHGGNKDLKTLTFDYIKDNFNYSILEIYKSTVDDNIIFKREQWWINTLQTRKFGYNN